MASPNNSPTLYLYRQLKRKGTGPFLAYITSLLRLTHQNRQGITSEGYGNHSYRITTVEKTIADCFDLPQYSGGYAELIRPFIDAPLDNEKLIAVSDVIHNIAATKRMGYLADLLRQKELEAFIAHAEAQVNEKYNLFDPAGSDEGEFVNRWKLRLNISEEKLLDIVNKPY